MSNTLRLQKKDLLNIITALQLLESNIRDQQLQTVNAGAQMGVDVSALGEYYSKRLALVERNKKNIQWVISRIDEAKEFTVTDNVGAVISVTEFG